ncbi:diaminobutyrate acetyltransferase [Zeimonas arvi]|uniref:L-2,4-diaminobutyric acid acetyltransferase n=1 Tax=Zeimonas arvi TaxID=2498847 RepID=A0A5C8NRY2_9BURK|nr:diaminobutyrate acetyltransferase [Zeimonas arvi]TXL63585.1 diaminobutyrate acetyltransferase [Zeimonas arvi]
MTDTDPGKTATSDPIRFRPARQTDGAALWRLVKATGQLELNSAYFYLLFASDFGDTCLVAERDGEVVGAVIGYHPPRQADTAFVWQIGVLPALRGQGLGQRLLDRWLALPANRACRWVTATVDEDNRASRALFGGFARRHGAECTVSPLFMPEQFPNPHPAEPLLRIGPIDRKAGSRAEASRQDRQRRELAAQDAS